MFFVFFFSEIPGTVSFYILFCTFSKIKGALRGLAVLLDIKLHQCAALPLHLFSVVFKFFLKGGKVQVSETKPLKVLASTSFKSIETNTS